MNALATPILHETSSNHASPPRILISSGGLAAFAGISRSFYAQIQPGSQQLLT